MMIDRTILNVYCTQARAYTHTHTHMYDCRCINAYAHMRCVAGVCIFRKGPVQQQQKQPPKYVRTAYYTYYKIDALTLTCFRISVHYSASTPPPPSLHTVFVRFGNSIAYHATHAHAQQMDLVPLARARAAHARLWWMHFSYSGFAIPARFFVVVVVSRSRC